jgi:microsomal dipeptidase-like Zn-dependent dipeptidase
MAGVPRQDEIVMGERRNSTVPENSKVAIFDGHNDVVQHLAEYGEGGRDFLVRSEDGHLDLPRAQEGGMVGGLFALFALFAKPERPPKNDFTRTAHGYEVRLDVRPDADLDPNTPINMVTEHLSYLVERMGEDHVALGSDFDGAVMPLAIKDASHLPNLIQSLRAHGFDDATVGKIAYDNWMRVFRLIWR